MAPAIVTAQRPKPAVYAESVSGFSIAAPPGWRRLRDGERELPRSARAAFADARDDVVVYIVVEFVPGGVIARNDEAVARYVALMTAPNANRLIRMDPVPVTLAGRRGLRTAMTIAPGGDELVNEVTVVREGYYYFTIASFAPPREERRQDDVHRAFEGGVSIAKSSDDVIAGLAGPIRGFAPYLTAADLPAIAVSVLDRSTSADPSATATLAFTTMTTGLDRLPAADRDASKALQAKALATLPDADRELAERVGAEIASGATVPDDDTTRCLQAFGNAYATLSRAESVTVRRIALDALRLGLEAYDNRPRPRPPAVGVPAGEPGGVPGGMPGGVPGGEAPPPLPDAPGPAIPRIMRVSGGVLAGRATRRVQPVYPEMARAAGIEGAVVVEVTVGESGQVISARAVSGHPLLRDAAVEAARGWAIQPFEINGAPVKVVGTITFQFKFSAPPASAP